MLEELRFCGNAICLNSSTTIDTPRLWVVVEKDDFVGGIGEFEFPLVILPWMMVHVERRRSDDESVQILHYCFSFT